ncbi:hypothetical protein QTP88_012272 [Uroleucon formosanum]
MKVLKMHGVRLDKSLKRNFPASNLHLSSSGWQTASISMAADGVDFRAPRIDLRHDINNKEVGWEPHHTLATDLRKLAQRAQNLTAPGKYNGFAFIMSNGEEGGIQSIL